MDPSSKHKSILKSKIKKRRKLVLVESLGDGKKKVEGKKETKIEQKIEKKKPSIIFDDDKKPSPLTLKLEKKETKKEVVEENQAVEEKQAVEDKQDDKPEDKDEIDDKGENEEKDDIDVKIKANKAKKQLDTKKIIEEGKPVEFIKKTTAYIYDPDLSTNMDDLSVIKPGEKFYICAYRIDNTGMLPFLQYCFHKDKTDTLSFPVLRSDGKTTVDKQGTKFINHIFKQSPECSFFTRIREGHNYLFYNVDYTKPRTQFMLKKSQWWWALITEIVNYQKLITFRFAPNVHPIFINNPSLIYLKDERNNIIEIPEVGFHGTYFNLINFITTYGLRPSTLNSMMGPYFYFGTFRKAVRYAGWTSTYKPREIDGELVTDSEGRYNRGGIVRFAMFLGKMKAFLNQPNERDDFSEFVRMKIKEQPRSENWERLVIKLHDHNGKWAEEYDSCYVGRVKLANGGLFMKNPEFVLKEFKQQHMLTSHELDKSTLKRNWDGNYDGYNIL